MKIHTKAIPLPSSKTINPDERLVKRGARALFNLLHSTVGQAQRVPGLFNQAASDIRDAWAESRPNV